MTTILKEKRDRMVILTEGTSLVIREGDLLSEGRYEAIQLLGRGAFGCVFEAKDRVR